VRTRERTAQRRKERLEYQRTHTVCPLRGEAAKWYGPTVTCNLRDSVKLGGLHKGRATDRKGREVLTSSWRRPVAPAPVRWVQVGRGLRKKWVALTYTGRKA
jgi:hypothetical protein